MHENNDIVEYRAPARQFEIKQYTYSKSKYSTYDEEGKLTGKTDKDAMDELLTDLGLPVSWDQN